MRVQVDANQCQGHGLCQMTAPQVFALRDEDGHAYVLEEEVDGDLATAAREGADSCPERAINVG
ncbi:ferredoxin [Amycolatopsis sp. K13G38]|uniref:Ferredoxin n=1 Tax=Amycolatopsis acididurans TaxID=2724524 RepID=A0ABX1J7L0_9PSEU|nr:ferredoxin [Amycolatopsis acididurans]NKQ55776.1 ferredoxin [Amycolatopsis acididurans]